MISTSISPLSFQRIWGPVLAFLFVSIPFAALPQSTPSEKVDALSYSFRIELNDSTDTIAGNATIELRARTSLRDFELDLVQKSPEGKGMTVRSVSRNGTALKFVQANDKVRIALPDEIGAEGVFTIAVDYYGVPADGLIISKNKYGDRTFFADNWPNRGRNWLPLIDHPADKSKVEFIVVAPLHYEVIANGVRVEECWLNVRQKLTRYREEVPIPTKVMVIGVAKFAVQQSGVIGHIPVESWVYPQNKEEGFYDYALAGPILEYFIDRVGPYSYKKLANVQSKTMFGGLENASAIFYFENSVTGQRTIEMLIAHEIAHQWFGNSASEKEWHDIWLSEGFATYFALLFAEHTYGDKRRQELMQEDRQQVLDFHKSAALPVVNPGTKDLMALLNANSYQKGSWVLHMLRRKIGDKAFWNGIQSYYKKYQNSNASTADFRTTMEEASGENLEAFFQQWVHTAGHPVIDVSWKYDADKKQVNGTLVQLQKGGPFSFLLELGLAGKDGEIGIEKIQVDQEKQSFSFKISEKPSKIVLDPQVNLLFEGKISQ